MLSSLGSLLPLTAPKGGEGGAQGAAARSTRLLMFAVNGLLLLAAIFAFVGYAGSWFQFKYGVSSDGRAITSYTVGIGPSGLTIIGGGSLATIAVPISPIAQIGGYLLILAGVLLLASLGPAVFAAIRVNALALRGTTPPAPATAGCGLYPGLPVITGLGE